MTPEQRRAKAVIERFGDPFTVGASERKGVFAPLSRERALDLFTEAQWTALPLPAWLVATPHDDPTAVNDPLTWNGATLTVRKAVESRAKGQTVARLLVVA